MARGARPRGQRYALERMMSRADYEALEAWRQDRRDRVDDSDELTVANDDNDEEGDERGGDRGYDRGVYSLFHDLHVYARPHV